MRKLIKIKDAEEVIFVGDTNGGFVKKRSEKLSKIIFCEDN